MKYTLKSPLVIINSLLIAFLLVLVFNANAERLHLPGPVKQALAAVAAITGSGTSGKLAAFAAVNQIGDSIIQDDGTNIGIGSAPASSYKAYVNGKLGVLTGIDVGNPDDVKMGGGYLSAGTNVENQATLGSSFNNGWRFIVVPSLQASGFNAMAQLGDTGLIFSKGAVNTGALILGPWVTDNVGIRLTTNSIGISVGTSAGNRIDLSAPIVSVNGNFSVTGTFSKTAGQFLIDHPLDPQNKYLGHSFVESPEMRNVYYGQAATVNGTATITLPDWWMALNGSNKAEYNYQFTPMGKWCQLYVAKEIENNAFTVASANGDCRFSWTLAGVRHDAYAQAHRIQVEGVKGDGNSFAPATYFHPELFK